MALIQTARNTLAQHPAEASKRREHDFVTASPVKSAGACFLKMTLQDWKPHEAVQISQQLVDAPRSDSSILIKDMVLPTPRLASGSGGSLAMERSPCSMYVQCQKPGSGGLANRLAESTTRHEISAALVS